MSFDNINVPFKSFIIPKAREDAGDLDPNQLYGHGH